MSPHSCGRRQNCGPHCGRIKNRWSARLKKLPEDPECVEIIVNTKVFEPDSTPGLGMPCSRSTAAPLQSDSPRFANNVGHRKVSELAMRDVDWFRLRPKRACETVDKYFVSCRTAIFPIPVRQGHVGVMHLQLLFEGEQVLAVPCTEANVSMCHIRILIAATFELGSYSRPPVSESGDFIWCRARANRSTSSPERTAADLRVAIT